MREKITDLKRIEVLYKEGKISRSTFWRAKKRGYIILNYHSPSKLSNNELKQEDKKELYNVIRAKVINFVTLNLRVTLPYNDMTRLIDDITHDVFLFILERKPVNRKQAIKMIKYGIYSLYQHPMWYRDYLDFPTRKAKQEKFLDIEQLK